MINSAPIAVVTGASSGIGQAIALHLAASGYRVFGASRRVTGLKGIDEIKLDVVDDASVEAGVARVLAEVERIDVLINNAGFAMLGAAEESSSAQIQAMFETNLFGAMRMTRAVLPGMRARRYGRIIHISSLVGLLPAPFSGLYAATKHALEGWSESLDHEVRQLGIRSILLEPGFIATNISGHMPTADQLDPSYDRDRGNVEAAFTKSLKAAPGPQIVAEAALHAIVAARPRVRYAVGSDAKLLVRLRRFLPASAFENAFRQQFGLSHPTM